MSPLRSLLISLFTQPARPRSVPTVEGARLCRHCFPTSAEWTDGDVNGNCKPKYSELSIMASHHLGGSIVELISVQSLASKIYKEIFKINNQESKQRN